MLCPAGGDLSQQCDLQSPQKCFLGGTCCQSGGHWSLSGKQSECLRYLAHLPTAKYAHRKKGFSKLVPEERGQTSCSALGDFVFSCPHIMFECKYKCSPKMDWRLVHCLCPMTAEIGSSTPRDPKWEEKQQKMDG